MQRNGRKSVPSLRGLNWRQVHFYYSMCQCTPFEQAQIALQKATPRGGDSEPDERSQRACEQTEQYEKELAELVLLRLTDAENGWAKSKAEAETLHAPTAKSPDNMEEGQVTRMLSRLMEAMRECGDSVAAVE
jgi:hypothetical protein